MTKKRGLNKGLFELLPEQLRLAQEDSGARVIDVSIEDLQAGKYQPRKNIGEKELQELSCSIKSHGVLQPLVVRRHDGNFYEIIAGERRWRAAKLAGCLNVPVIVKQVDDVTALALAVVENIQRAALTPLEEACSFERLISEFALNHEEIGKLVGRSRSAVSNILRLLSLQSAVKEMLADNQIELGHGKALLGLPINLQYAVALKVVKHNWSVRDTENYIREQKQQKLVKKTINNTIDGDISILQRELSEYLAANVLVKHNNNGSGRLEISYHSVDELEGILAKIHKVG